MRFVFISQCPPYSINTSNSLFTFCVLKLTFSKNIVHINIVLIEQTWLMFYDKQYLRYYDYYPYFIRSNWHYFFNSLKWFTKIYTPSTIFVNFFLIKKTLTILNRLITQIYVNVTLNNLFVKTTEYMI